MTDPPPADGPPLWRKGLIFCSYMVSICCVGIPPALYPALQRDLGFTSGGIASILACETAGTAVGKVFAGFWADAVGGRRAYLCACVALALATLHSGMAEWLGVWVCWAGGWWGWGRAPNPYLERTKVNLLVHLLE